MEQSRPVDTAGLRHGLSRCGLIYLPLKQYWDKSLAYKPLILPVFTDSSMLLGPCGVSIGSEYPTDTPHFYVQSKKGGENISALDWFLFTKTLNRPGIPDGTAFGRSYGPFSSYPDC